MYKKILERNPAIRSASVLIVDDSDVSRTVTKKFFTDVGITNIFFAENGSDALKKIDSVSPDIIIADIFMPKMNGFDFLSKVREIPGYDHTPIIIQTSTTDAKDVAKAFESGASDVVSKPIQKDEMLARAIFHLETVMFRKRIEKELQAARDLQNSIVPGEDEIDQIEQKYNMQISSHFAHCSEVGGDFWGFKKISHNELGVFTVDISGHGVAAALNTFRIQSLLNDSNNFFSSTSIFLKKLNKKTVELMPTGQFATMFYGVMNIAENFIQYSSAAAPGGLVIKNNDTVDMLKASGFPLGVEMQAEYDLFETKFEAGETLILFSDALIETADSKGKFLEIEEIQNILIANKDKSADDMLKAILKLFKSHVGDCAVTDDLTINIYKRL